MRRGKEKPGIALPIGHAGKLLSPGLGRLAGCALLSRSDEQQEQDAKNAVNRALMRFRH
jgi:hypothetical protein